MKLNNQYGVTKSNGDSWNFKVTEGYEVQQSSKKPLKVKEEYRIVKPNGDDIISKLNNHYGVPKSNEDSLNLKVTERYELPKFNEKTLKLKDEQRIVKANGDAITSKLNNYYGVPNSNEDFKVFNEDLKVSKSNKNYGATKIRYLMPPENYGFQQTGSNVNLKNILMNTPKSSTLKLNEEQNAYEVGNNFKVHGQPRTRTTNKPFINEHLKKESVENQGVKVEEITTRKSDISEFQIDTKTSDEKLNGRLSLKTSFPEYKLVDFELTSTDSSSVEPISVNKDDKIIETTAEEKNSIKTYFTRKNFTAENAPRREYKVAVFKRPLKKQYIEVKEDTSLLEEKTNKDKKLLSILKKSDVSAPPSLRKNYANETQETTSTQDTGAKSITNQATLLEKNHFSFNDFNLPQEAINYSLKDKGSSLRTQFVDVKDEDEEDLDDGVRIYIPDISGNESDGKNKVRSRIETVSLETSVTAESSTNKEQNIKIGNVIAENISQKLTRRNKTHQNYLTQTTTESMELNPTRSALKTTSPPALRHVETLFLSPSLGDDKKIEDRTGGENEKDEPQSLSTFDVTKEKEESKVNNQGQLFTSSIRSKQRKNVIFANPSLKQRILATTIQKNHRKERKDVKMESNEKMSSLRRSDVKK